MENRDDKLITDFLGKHKVEIQSDGFSKRVLNRLPEKQRRTGWIVPLFTLIGVVVSAFLIDIREIFENIFSLIMNVPMYYLLGGVMVFPIIFLFFYLYWEKSQASVFKF